MPHGENVLLLLLGLRPHISSDASAKSARSCRGRHQREAHGPDSLRWRRKRDAARIALLRRQRRDGIQRENAVVRACVLCPVRRERHLGLFSATRNALSEAGLHPSAVRRMQGLDLLAGRERDRGQTARSVVRASVFRNFIPKSTSVLLKESGNSLCLLCGG